MNKIYFYGASNVEKASVVVIYPGGGLRDANKNSLVWSKLAIIWIKRFSLPDTE